jgi:Cysteine-rich CPCC
MNRQFHKVTETRQSAPAFRCPCCRFKTLCGRAQNEICKVCFWEDDGQDDHDANEVRGGPNGTISLSRARDNFASFGAVERKFLAKVRKPLSSEL